jgi:hypothetical protein
MQKIQSPPVRRKRRRWNALVGGNRLTNFKRELTGDRNTLDPLPDDHPRRKPTLPVLHFLEDDEVRA